jgi:hypothetical protein
MPFKDINKRRAAQRKYWNGHKVERHVVARKYYASHREEHAAREVRFRQTVKAQWRAMERSARIRNLPFAVSFETFCALRELPCDYCNATLPDTGYCMDRMDNSLGYVEDNLVPCCPDCNYLKSNHISYDEMKKLMLNRMPLEHRLFMCQLPLRNHLPI